MDKRINYIKGSGKDVRWNYIFTSDGFKVGTGITDNGSTDV